MPEETLSPGRPKEALEDRLARAIDQPLALADWPNTNHPCWHGPRYVWLDGKSTPIMRAMFTLIFEQPLHPTWTFVRICPDLGCCNPHHFLPKIRNLSDGTPVEPLPARAYTRAAFAQLADPEQDVLDAMDAIIGSDGWRIMSVDELCERTGLCWSKGEIEEAVRRLKAADIRAT